MRISSVLLLISSGLQVLGQAIPHPLEEDGILDSISLSGSSFNAGGTISVNGRIITVPENLLVQFPAAWVPFKTLAQGSFTGNEVSIFGNIASPSK
jgi:hypothetical protein